MIIQRVLVVPGYGQMLPDGGIDRGRAVGRYCELDVVDGYARSLCEAMDEDGIRFEMMPTRPPKPVPESTRAKWVEANDLVLHLRAQATDSKPRAKNVSTITFGPGARELAEEIGEALSDWGQCYVFGHRTSNPTPELTDELVAIRPAVKIIPFDLAGPDVDEYMQRLPQLGQAVGRCVADYLTRRNQARARVPATGFGI